MLTLHFARRKYKKDNNKNNINNMFTFIIKLFTVVPVVVNNKLNVP